MEDEAVGPDTRVAIAESLREEGSVQAIEVLCGEVEEVVAVCVGLQ